LEDRNYSQPLSPRLGQSHKDTVQRPGHSRAQRAAATPQPASASSSASHPPTLDHRVGLICLLIHKAKHYWRGRRAPPSCPPHLRQTFRSCLCSGCSAPAPLGGRAADLPAVVAAAVGQGRRQTSAGGIMTPRLPTWLRSTTASTGFSAGGSATTTFAKGNCAIFKLCINCYPEAVDIRIFGSKSDPLLLGQTQNRPRSSDHHLGRCSGPPGPQFLASLPVRAVRVR
jgi:hypothetical protein